MLTKRHVGSGNEIGSVEVQAHEQYNRIVSILPKSANTDDVIIELLIFMSFFLIYYRVICQAEDLSTVTWQLVMSLLEKTNLLKLQILV